MRFKRISTDTVRCIVSQDELIENGLNMDDFMSNSGRTEEFLRKMLTQAEQEVGFRVQGGPLTIQVAALPENRRPVTVAVAWEALVTTAFVPEVHDIALDWIATEAGVRRSGFYNQDDTVRAPD